MADTNPHVQLRVGVDTSDATAGFDAVGKSAQKMAGDVSKASKQASDEVNKLGGAMKQSLPGPKVDDTPPTLPPEDPKSLAGKIRRQTGAVKSELQRLIAAAESAGQQSKRVEALIDFRGINKNDPEIAAYLSRLKQAEKGMGDLGMTTKATNAALRQVPAQFTDIVVSLAGGQAPLTVLLQQGGQLKDVFGGVGAAAKALGGYVLGLINPITVTAAAAATLGGAFYAGSREAAEFNKTLILTGNQAGLSAGQLTLMAQSIDSVAGTQGNAAEVLNQIASSGKIAASVVQQVATAAIAMERAGGPAAAELVKEFAKLGGDPLKSALELNKTYGFLTISTYEQVKALEEQGRTTEAATLVQKAFADTLNQRTPEMERNLGLLDRAWRGVRDAVTEAWDALKSIGREDSVQTQAAALGKSIADIEAVIETRRKAGYSTQGFEAELGKLKERQAILQSDERLLKSAATLQAEQTRQVEARAKWDKDGESMLSKKLKMEREIAQAIQLGTTAKISQAEVEKRIADIREKYKEKTPKGPKDTFAPGADAAREWEKYMQAFGAAAVDAQGKTDGLTKSQEKLIEYLGSSAYLNMDEPARELALQAAYAAISQEQLVESTKQQGRAMEEARKAASEYGKQLDAIALAGADLITQANERTQAVEDQVAATEFELSLMGKSNTERAIALKQYQIERDLKRDIAKINATIANQDDKDYAIDAARRAADRAKANAAAEVVNAEFQRVSQQIEQSLTDALMRGFESGKGFAEVLRDTVANMFKTLVLRPVIQATVQGGLNAVGLGSFGGQGAGSSLLGSAASNYVTSTLGSAVFGNSAAYGAALGTTSIGAGSQAAMLAAQTGEFGLAGLSATSGAAGGALSSLAAAGPYIAAAVALVALIDSLDDSGTLHTGGLGSYSAAGGTAVGDAVKGQGLSFNLSNESYNASTQQASTQMAQAIVGLLDSTAQTFGKEAGYWAATGFADDTSKDGAWGALAIKMGDTLLADWKDGADKWPGREFADGEAGAKEYAAAVALDVRNLLIEQTPEWADTMLNALGDAPTIEALAGVVAQINTAAAALDGMGRASQQFAALTDEATSALITALGGAEAAVANLSGYYANFYSETERTGIATAQLTEQLATLGVELPASREAFRAMVDAALEAGNPALAGALVALSDEFAALVPVTEAVAEAVVDTTAALARAAKDARTAALAQLEASVQRERTLWQQQATAASSLRDEVSGLFDLLSTNIQELRAEAVGPALSSAQGNQFIAQALAGVSAGVGLPDATDLGSAISAARGGLGLENFASAAEQKFATLKLAGELAVLQEAAGDQLSTAELQLAAANDQIEQLDQTLTYWRTQLDDNKTAIDATLSVAAAVDALRVLMFPEQDAKPGSVKPGSGGFTIGGGGGGTSTVAAESLSRLGNVYYGALGTAITDAGYIDRFDSINAAINTLDWSDAGKAASVATLTQAAIDNDVTTREIAISAGISLSDIEALLPDVPRYMVGTNYVPKDGLAYLHEGEAVVPKAYNPAANQQSGNADMVAELRALRAEVAGLRAQNAEVVLHTQRTANATNGQPDRPMLVETV